MILDGTLKKERV